MKGKYIWVSACFFVFGMLLGAVSLSASAQNVMDGYYVIVSGEGEGEKPCCAYIGVYMDDLTHRIRHRLNYPHETGVLITKIEPASPAEKAGLAEDDIVYLFNGTKVEDSARLASLVKAEKPGDKVALLIYRDGAEKKIAVTLGERKSPTIVGGDFGAYGEKLSKAMQDVNRSAVKIYRESLMTRGRLGMVLHDLNEDLAEYFNVEKGRGVLVLDIEAESPAAKAGIRPGDVIVAVDGTAVSDAGDFMDALSGTEEGDKISFDVIRKGAKKTVEIEVAEGSGTYNFSIAPFERSRIRKEPPDQYPRGKGADDAAALRQEMKALKERMKELEDRLNKAEKSE